MINLIALISLTLLSSSRQMSLCNSIDCSSGPDCPIEIISKSSDSSLNDDALSLPKASDIESSEYIRHYSVSSRTSTYELIPVSDEINMIEKTSKFGKGTSSIPVKNIKKTLNDVDNLVPIDFLSANNGYPMSAIGMVSSSDEDSNKTLFNGTIFMAPGGLGITAAHCVYSSLSGFINEPKANFSLTNIASNGEFVFEYSSVITDVFIPNLFFSSPNEADYDWAVVRFSDKNIETKTGSFNIASGFSMYGQTNTLIGFPRDKGFYPHSSSGYGVISTQPRYYDLYQTVARGMSGGPVMFNYFDSVTLDEFGVVTAINTKMHTTNGFQHLRATRISNSMVSLIRMLK